MGAITHVKSDTFGDFTGTVTVFNSQGSTVTAAATDLVRPTDWNSGHNFNVQISGNTAGTSSGAATNVVFGGTNGVIASMDTAASAATVWFANQFQSYFANLPAVENFRSLRPAQSTSHVVPFSVPQPLSFNFIRFYGSGSNLAASSTYATTNGANISAGLSHSYNFVIYGRGTGANSMSLQYVTSTQCTDQQSMRISANATAGSQYSATHRMTLNVSSGVSDWTRDYSSSQTNIAVNTSQITGYTALKQMDYYFPGSLTPGQYWLAFGLTSSTNSSSSSVCQRPMVSWNYVGVSQSDVLYGTYGDATRSSVNLSPAHGWFTRGAAAGTTSSIDVSAVNNTGIGSQLIVYFQLMRIA